MRMQALIAGDNSDFVTGQEGQLLAQSSRQYDIPILVDASVKCLGHTGDILSSVLHFGICQKRSDLSF
jgi:hypothetical protein